MNISKYYFDDEVEGWSTIARFFGLNPDTELDTDFEKTQELYNTNLKLQTSDDLITVYSLSYNDKSMLIISDLQTEAVYIID